MNRFHRSLRTRITLYTAVGLAIILGVMTLLSVQILSTATQVMLEDWQGDVKHSAEYLQALAGADERLMRHLGAELLSDPATAPALLQDVASRMAVFQDGLVWLKPDGTVQGAAPAGAAKLLENIARSDLLPSPGQASRYSDLLHASDGKPLVTCVAAVDGGGYLVAIASLQSGVLQTFLPLPDFNGHASVVDHNGWVLESTLRSIRFTQKEHPRWLSEMMKNGVPTVGETTGDNAQMMAFAPVGSTGWGLTFGEPVTMVLASRVQLLHRALLLGLAAVLLVIVFAWWDTGTLTRSLARLTAQAERIAGGDLATSAPVRRRDEVGLLSQTFETMRERLDQSRTELNQALAEAVRRREETSALYAVSREILRPSAGDDPLRTIVDRAEKLLGEAPVAIVLTPSSGEPASETSGPSHPGSEDHHTIEAEIVEDGAVLGRLCVTERTNHPVSDQDRRLVAGLADLAALALGHARLHEQSRRLTIYAERERIARDLHDSVSQSLSYLYSQLALLQELLPGITAEQVHTELQSLAEVASATFDETRDSIYSLRASSSADPLPSAIVGCVRDFTARTGTPVDLDTDAMAGARLSAEAEAQLVRMVQEALTNVAKHARARRVTVQAGVREGSVEIAIHDDGAGFDPNAPRSGRRSFGLEMMRERVESVGGVLSIESRRGHGTWVRARIPIAG